MPVAVYQVLCAHTGALRVYPTNETEPPTPYKFFTLIRVWDDGDTAEIVGMRDSKITVRDFSAVMKELARVGFKSAWWTHNGSRQDYDITRKHSTSSRKPE